MSDQLFEHAVRDWLEDGSDRTPPAAIEAVLLAVRTTPQARSLRILRTFTQAAPSLRFAAAVALVALLGVALLLLGAGDRTSPRPTPTQTTEPSASSEAALGNLIDTSDWIAYTSERYGFDIKRPPDWSETPAERDWTIADASDFAARHSESFEYSEVQGLGIIVTVWSVAVEAGTAVVAWIDAYCPVNTEPCDDIQGQSEAITMDGHPGLLVQFNNDSQAFFLVDGRMYVAAIWRPDIDLSTRRYGSSSRLLRTFVSTMSLRPGGPAPAVTPPALTESFTSARYGYSIDFPALWTVTPAATLWVPGQQVSNWDDAFVSESETIGLRASSAIVPDGVVVDDWISQEVRSGHRSECVPALATLGSIVIDGQDAAIRTSCKEVEATLFLGGRLYLFTLFDNSGATFVPAGAQNLFLAMMATVSLTPETAEVAPSPAAS